MGIIDYRVHAKYNMAKQLIKSISYSNDEIIDNIIKLHCKGNISLDPTYGRGNFYKNIPEPIIKMDLYPQAEGVIKANVEFLPLRDSSMETIIFDPPFLATTGKMSTEDDNNIIVKRFGLYPNEKELHSFYSRALQELYRVLQNKGILICRSQDKVSGGKQYFSHVYIINEAERIGYYVKDLFILLAKNRIIADWQRNQKHARKFHSYYIVLKKSKRKIEYV